MNRKLLFWLTLILLSMSSLPLFSQFAGGSGTEQDPWQVATAEHLNNLRKSLGSNHAGTHFIQTADIDLGVAPWNQGEGWVPVGYYHPYFDHYAFYGHYDGDGYIITGLYINRPNDDNQGLFGYFRGTIQNLGLTNVNVTGGNYTGSLVGENSHDVYIYYGSISNCHSTGSVTGRFYAGGLVGKNYGNIDNCYSSANVTGDGYTGGLVGSNGSSSSSIDNCYSIGNITGGGSTSGLVGSGLYCSNSYWDIIKSGQIYSDGGEGRYTSEMVFPHSTNTYFSWDWRIWKPDPNHTINDGYPYFRDPDETVTQTPYQAACLFPQESAISVLTDVSLQWNLVFTPENLDPSSGFKLWLGTDNPPTNICNGLDLGYSFEYTPSSGLQPNTIYYWKSVPYNEIGEAQDCPIWSFSTYDPNFSVSYPSGGETWLSGTTRTILWTENASPDVELSISYDGGNHWERIATINNGRYYYHYQVPTVNSSLCKIKIVSQLDGSQYHDSNGFFSIYTSSTRPKVILTYPSEENTHLKVDGLVNLSWIRQNVNTVSLDYSLDDGQNWTEIASGINDDSYSWMPPDTISPYCRIRVRSDLNSEVLDISDNFFIIGNINLLSPNGHEILTGDYSGHSVYPISWSAPEEGFLDIDYSPNGGENWTRIISSYPANQNSFDWSICEIPGNNYKIRITFSENNAMSAISDAAFSIRNPIKLTKVNGGYFVSNYSTINVRWKMQDIDPTSKIFWEYSFNNYHWTRINSSAVPVSDESMYWFVNTGLANNCWLRAVEEGSNRILTKSESSFRVTDKILMLFEPNGDEEYNALSTQTISWDHDGLTNLNILFSSDDGETWTQIAENVPASDLNYTWLVPDTPSSNCCIRLQDQTHTYMRLDSDLPFSILPLQVIDPTVDFTADALSGEIPLSVQFTEDVNPGVGNIATRLWDFGDGITSTDANPLHVYQVPGSYTVSLTVTNEFGGSATETKEDYISALPQTPRIELLSDASLNFGVVYLGDVSPAQSIEVKNIGTAPLHIDSASFHLPNSQFALTDTELPITVPVDGSALLKVVFIPVVSGAVSDSIFIHSDASNEPSLAVRLNAIGEFVPPAAVEGVEIWVEGDDYHLSWDPVTETIYGTPIEPDGYIVLYNETPYEDEHFYYFLAYVPETNHVHHNVALFRKHMFYRIVAVKFYRGEEIAWLRSLNSERDRKMTWGEVKEELAKMKSRP